MSDAPYEVLAGRYELHRQLATGGSADVFLARDQLLNRPVAVKVLNATLSEDQAFVERLRREAQLVASLNHQNIVGVFDQGEQDGAPFIVMEYVNGRSLAEILRSEGHLHPDRAATIAVDVAAALDAAHRQGMVHMDVKPGNVLITAEGQVKLADFGIAKALNEGSETDLTAEGGTVMGTATYLSPEQAQGHKVGPRSDVYSLAVLLYEMMTGRPPFIGDTPADIARKHVEEAPQAPRQLGVDIAQSLEAITLKGLAKSPANRYPSVRDFAADLKRYLAGAHSLSGGAVAAAGAGVVAAGVAAAAGVAGAAPNPPIVRPLTGRSTPPESSDATTIIPATVAAAPLATAPRASAPATATVVASSADPVAVESRPVVVRTDDTWKRNVLFFIALCVLLLLLGFLARAFIDVLRGDDAPANSEDLEDVETVTLPNFTNFERDQAINLIENQGLVPEIEFEPNNDVGEGRVFKQDPPAGAIVPLGSTVLITVSEAEGKVEVPTLVELTREEAERQLRRLGFTPDIREVDNDVFSPGEVISQDPLPGTSADRGSVIFLEVSLGPSERTVPDLAGQSLNEALNKLFELDFRITQIEEPDPQVEEGLVLRTEPPAGSLLRGGEIVTLYVSSGVARVPVPSVVGLLADSARQQLTASGFKVQIDFIEVEDLTQVNKVVDQTPPANIELPEGETVRIIVGLEPPPEETTTTVAPTTTTAAATTTAAPTTTTVADG
jgi:beta-lactam-binding protein with PASTA domain/predicted Ser/Thr protein kinase